MLNDRLALSVTTNDGRVIRWGGDESSAQMIPGDLEFSTSVPGGYKDLSCSLLRQLSGDERLFNRVRAYGPGNRTAWDGRLVQFPREDLNVNPAAVGWAGHLRDDTSFREIYVDRDLTHWVRSSVQNQLTASTVWDDSFRFEVLPDQVTSQPALKTAISGDWSGMRARCEAWYDGNRVPLGSLSYAWKINGNVSAADTNWVWRVWLSDDDVGSTVEGGTNLRAAGPGTGTLTATVANKSWGIVQFFYDTVPSTGHQSIEYAAYWTVLAMYGRHGLPQQGSLTATTAPGFFGHDLINNVVSRAAPLLTTGIGAGMIEENSSFVVPQAAFLDPTTAEDVIMLLNGYFLWEWGVYDNKQFFWRPPDPNRLVWRARKDRGARVSLEGETAEAQFNGVIVRYTDTSGNRQIAGPPAQYWEGGVARADVTDATLVDTSVDNAVNKAGIPRRWGILDIGPVTSDLGAVQLGVVWLAEHRLPQRRGTITMQGQVEHPTEGFVPPWRVRAGDGVVVTDLLDDEPRRIIETRYNRGSDTVSCSVGNTDFKLDSILERIGVNLIGVL
jgi:hypothetical protein